MPSSHVPGRWRALAVAALLAALLVGAAARSGGAAAADSLVLSPAGLRGWHAVHVSAATARADLGRSARPAAVQAAGARRGRLSLRSEAFLVGRPAAAARAVRAHRGATLVRSRRGAVATVVWRERARVGLLRLAGPRHDRTLLRQARDLARPADAALRTPLPHDRWGRVLQGIRADGSVPLRTALRGFAVAYGGLPGVTAPRGRRTLVPDGTEVIAWMYRHARELSARQRAVADRRLGIRLPDRQAHAAADFDDSTFKPDRDLTEAAYTFVPEYAALTGHQLGLPIVVGTSDVNRSTKAHGEAAADATPTEDPDGRLVCRVRMLPLGMRSKATFRSFLIAHETFHCFQFDLAPDRWRNDADWIIEGGAEWAAATVDPVPEAGQFLPAYIDTPGRPLFARDYDAVGFWGHAADMSTPETIFRDMGKVLNAPNVTDAYGAAGGFGSQFLTDWGPSVFRKTTFTPEWTMRSPVTPPDFSAQPPGDLTVITDHGDVSAVPYATAQYIVHTGEEVLHVGIAGHAEIYSNGLEYSDLGDAYFCLREECSCPPGSEGDLPPLRPLFDLSYLGVTGDPGKGTTGAIAGMSLADFCHPTKPPPPAGGGGQGGDGCTGPCGSSDGDPHLETIAGHDYDFQAAGEFTAVKSTDDDLEIQARQEPFRSPDLTVDTAVAMNVAGDRVEIDRGSPPVIRVDGAAAPAGGPLPHGGTVAVRPDATAVTWPDGSEAQVWSVGPWGVAFLFQPAAARLGHLAGLLGGDAGHLVGRDGQVYPAAALEGHRGFAAKYRRFGESWRIAAGDSLFTYAAGKSTASYTDRAIPGRLRTAGSLPAHVRGAAEATCRREGITRAAILRDCALDVGATHEAAFAAAGAALQRTAAAPHVPAPPPAGSRTTRFVTTCDPAGGDPLPVGSDAGIEIDLQTADGHEVQTDGQLLIHWPEDGEVDPAEPGDTSDFHELDTPGVHTAYATFAGDAGHDPAQSVVCEWDVAG